MTIDPVERDLHRHLEQEYQEDLKDQARERVMADAHDWLKQNTPVMRGYFHDDREVLDALNTEDFDTVYEAVNCSEKGDNFYARMTRFQRALEEIK